MKRKSYRRDQNHAELTDQFEQLGCTVEDLSQAGVEGLPDVVVGCMGENHLVEFKNPKTAYGRAGLNLNQQGFDRRWRGGRVWAVSSRDEVTALVQNWRRRERSAAA